MDFDSVLAAAQANSGPLGTAAVAAGVGGAHAAGIVDVPGLPDRTPPIVQEVPGDATDGADGKPDVEVGHSDGADEASSGTLGEDARDRAGELADQNRRATPATDKKPDNVPVPGENLDRADRL